MELPSENSAALLSEVLPQEAIRDYDFRVCYEDTDAGGVVYHARYLGIADRARTESMRKVGGNISKLVSEFGLILVVRQLEIHYKKPLFLDDIVTVRTTLLTTLGASCWLSQLFIKDKEVVTDMKLQLVCLRKDDYTPAAFPPKWKQLFSMLQEI